MSDTDVTRLLREMRLEAAVRLLQHAGSELDAVDVNAMIQGYATQALEALEAHAKPNGVKKLGLHVFGHNTAARELYKKAGYLETNVSMAKVIV